MFDAEDIARQVRHNCDISDARHAGLYSICGLALRLRDLCKWDTGTPAWEEKEPADVLEWIGDREAHWDKIVDEDYTHIAINGRSYPPFDTLAINEVLDSHGLYYGAGYGYSLKPTFFLAAVENRRQINGIPVYTLGRELARDLMTLPALSQNRQVLLRTDAARLYLWDQMLYVKPSGKRALSFALRACGINDHRPDSLRRRLDRIFRAHKDAFIYHELGEIHDRVFDRHLWQELIAAFPHSPVELLARSVKDLLADTGRRGTLAHVIVQKNTASLGFFTAFYDGLAFEIFTELRSAFERFTATGNWQAIEEARRKGHHKAKQIAEEMISIYGRGKQKDDVTWAAETIETRLLSGITKRGARA
jgi:hypothetical protein